MMLKGQKHTPPMILVNIEQWLNLRHHHLQDVLLNPKRGHNLNYCHIQYNMYTSEKKFCKSIIILDILINQYTVEPQ